MVEETQAIDLDNKIEELALHELDEKAIHKVIDGMSTEAYEIRKKRKAIRWLLYRIQLNAIGRANEPTELQFEERGIDVDINTFKEHFEKQTAFGGWKYFAENWDVDLVNPWDATSRATSTAEEWDAVIRSKYPTIKPGGQIHYPDIKVKEAVEKEAELQKKLKEQE